MFFLFIVLVAELGIGIAVFIHKGKVSNRLMGVCSNTGRNLYVYVFGNKLSRWFFFRVSIFPFAFLYYGSSYL